MVRSVFAWNKRKSLMSFTFIFILVNLYGIYLRSYTFLSFLTSSFDSLFLFIYSMLVVIFFLHDIMPL